MATRKLFSPLFLLAILVVLLPNLAVARPEEPAPSVAIDPQILAEMAAAPDGRTGFFALFGEQADLNAADSLDWSARGRLVYERLQETAALSQAGARAWLDARGIPYQSFFINNSIYLTADRAVLEAVAALPGVTALHANHERALAPVSSEGPSAPQATIPWNISQVGADLVWQDFGVKGQGIVVATIDTGAEYTHDALYVNYRCGAGPHENCWLDPSGSCGTPCDTNGHGTMVLGVIAGDDDPALTYNVGMAPDAQWIACRGCPGGSCSEYDLHTCAQWLLAPNGDPSMRPNIVNNSWGGGSGCDSWFLADIMAWQAAGIFSTFAPGGSGPGCTTISAPAAYSEAFATSATDQNDLISPFSGRGPSPCDGGIKPEVSAPGVQICTTLPGNSWSCSLSGTSFSSPHSAGLAALLWSADPAMIGQLDQTRTTIETTALCIDDGSCGGGACPLPNNVYGWGRIDAYAAVESVLPTGPQLAVDPAALEATLFPDSSVTQELWITNTGDAALTFTVTEFTRTILAEPLPTERVRSDPVVDPALRAQVQSGGQTPAIIYLRDLPDLSGASSIRDWAARGRYVYGWLQQNALLSQELFGLLKSAGAAPRRFLASSAIAAMLDAKLLDQIAARSEVAAIAPDQPLALDPAVLDEQAPQTVEWNIAKIGADQAWAQFGVTGQGATVGNIGTGVMYTHPALVTQYRGNLGGGNFDHNYNWFDFVAGQAVPYDDVYHSTFGMGIAVGDDGGNNQIGVAPGAKWVAAKACDAGFACSEANLLAAMDWMLAPTDLGGGNPNPALRPQIVFSLWGGGQCSATFQPAIQAWRAAGMLPIFATGGGGPLCNSIASPADLPESFTAGATDNNDNIGSFSGRGPSCYGEIKPEVAAPGVNVRSANNAGGYQTGSGSSWAVSHLAGAAALVYSADPSLDGIAIEGILTSTALCRTDTTCGGTACHNDTYGWGRIDAFQAVSLTLAQLVPDVVSWLDETPTAGTLEPGEGVAVSVTFDSTGLPPNSYRAGLLIDSNDPVTPAVQVPVTMTVVACDPVVGADFTWTPTEPQVGQSVILTGTAWGLSRLDYNLLHAYQVADQPTPPISFTWDLGDGAVATGQFIQHTYSLPGVYTVTLTATNCTTATATAVHTITVLPLPCDPVTGAVFAWTPITPTAGQVVTLTGSATGTLPITLTWDLGDGTTGSGSTVVHTYNSPGSYLVRMTAANACGSQDVTHLIVVEAPPFCEPVVGADFTWAPITPTVSEWVTFTATWSPGPAGWLSETVDSVGDVGRDLGLALDTSDRPHISYYDYTNTALKYAVYDGSVWQLTTVDAGGDVGQFTSLVLDGANRPHISYYDATNAALKYAYWTGSAWDIQTVDSTGSAGRCTSLALDSAGRPHISYFDDNSNSIKYAWYDGSAWHIIPVDGTVGPACDTSLALDPTDRPHIAYFVSSYDIRYAAWDGSAWQMQTAVTGGDKPTLALAGQWPYISYSGNWGTNISLTHFDGSMWHDEVVENTGGPPNRSSLVLDANGPRLSYYSSASGGDLRYAWPNGYWRIESVVPGSSAGEFSSLALDSTGQPRIAYYDEEGGDLHYTRYDIGATPPISLHWDMGDGSEATGGVVSHGYALPGTYTVTLTATNCTTATAVAVHTITVEGPCEPVSETTFTWLPVTPTVGQETAFTAWADKPVLTFTWSFGDGTFGAGDLVTHTYTLAGVYPVTLTATNACGAATAVNTVTVVAAVTEWRVYLPIVIKNGP